MTNSPRVQHEIHRLAELRRHEILDTEPEPAFERIVGIAERFFAMPMVAVTFVDQHRAWCKASRGLAFREAARESSFCAHAIHHKGVLVVPDTQLDVRFRDHHLVLPPDGVRFYAGAPLRAARGHVLGALCVMDTAPREFTQEDEDTLADMAELVMAELRLRRLTASLHSEVCGGKSVRRVVSRQHRLLQRLRDAQDGCVRQRTAELRDENEALRAEIECLKLVGAGLGFARDKALAADQAKSEFLARMSHELRTPLNAILGFGQILQGDVSGSDQRECATQVVTAGRHMLSLINEVLDLSRIEEGRSQLALAHVRVAELVEEAIDLIRPLAARRGVTVEISRHAEPALEAFADRLRLKQVLLNLLSNAVKYGPDEGRVTIGWRATTTRAVRLTITDRGPGLGREQTSRLFLPFERLGAESTDVPGTGLGLALTKRLVDLMGGKVGVRTAPGRGSTFWAEFPLSLAGERGRVGPDIEHPGPTLFPPAGQPVAARLPQVDVTSCP